MLQIKSEHILILLMCVYVSLSLYVYIYMYMYMLLGGYRGIVFFYRLPYDILSAQLPSLCAGGQFQHKFDMFLFASPCERTKTGT